MRHVDGQKEQTFPVHADFVPHNFITKNGYVVLLDYENMIISNKSDDYARITNYYMGHNSDTYLGLIDKFHDEPLFKEMRVYKALYLAHYYYLKYKSYSSDLVKSQHKFWVNVVGKLCKNKDPYNKAEIDMLRAMERAQTV